MILLCEIVNTSIIQHISQHDWTHVLQELHHHRLPFTRSTPITNSFLSKPWASGALPRSWNLLRRTLLGAPCPRTRWALFPRLSRVLLNRDNLGPCRILQVVFLRTCHCTHRFNVKMRWTDLAQFTVEHYGCMQSWLPMGAPWCKPIMFYNEIILLRISCQTYG